MKIIINISFFFLLRILKQLKRISSLAWCDINSFQLRILRASISPRDQNLLKIPSLSCSENSETHFIVQAAPQGGSTFHSGISVPLLTVLFSCPAFRSNLVSFLFHSEGTALFLLMFFGFLLSSSVVKSVFCGSLNAETLTSSNEELLLSDASE